MWISALYVMYDTVNIMFRTRVFGKSSRSVTYGRRIRNSDLPGLDTGAAEGLPWHHRSVHSLTPAVTSVVQSSSEASRSHR